MATKALLGRLAFRAVSVPLPAATKITIRYGKDIGTCAGHTSARYVSGRAHRASARPPHVLTAF